jgi:GWxTD domain-containing protein
MPVVWPMVQAPPVPDRDWKRWLNDVAPLLTPAEKSEATKASAADREKVRDAFWARRNPEPQAAENPARAEYELRVRTADKRFRNGADGAWNDCGRTFVLLGKPDRVTNTAAASHFTGDPMAAAREQDDREAETWLYRTPPRLPPSPEGYGFRFTQICESVGGPSFQRLLGAVAATYVVTREP